MKMVTKHFSIKLYEALFSVKQNFAETHNFVENQEFRKRQMDKEDVVHIYNGILLSHKKERNWVICRDMDGSRDCHTEWSKSEREKQILYINAYMWNLEKWYSWTGLQGRNRDTDVENKRMDTKGREWRVGGGGVMNWEIRIDIYTLICVKWLTNKNLLYKKNK